MNSLDRLRQIATLSFFLVTVAIFNMSFVQYEDSAKKPESIRVDTVVATDKTDSCCVSPGINIKELHRADALIDEMIKVSMQKAIGEIVEKADEKTDSQFSKEDEAKHAMLRAMTRFNADEEISRADASMTSSLTRSYFISQLHQVSETDVAKADNRSDGHFFSTNQMSLDTKPASFITTDKIMDTHFSNQTGVAINTIK